MRPILLAILVLLAAPHAAAQEYGHYDLAHRLLTTSDAADPARVSPSGGGSAAGMQHGIDVEYLDQVINDLGRHAKNYPPKFDTPQDKERAIKDVTMLSGVLDGILGTPPAAPDLLLRAGLVNSIGHNLDIPGTGNRANAIFLQLLEAKPDDPYANFAFGAFLGGAGRPLDALPYLQKALELGVSEGAYGLGFAYLTLGNKEQALKYLEQYRASTPEAGVDELIKAIKDGRVEMKRAAK